MGSYFSAFDLAYWLNDDEALQFIPNFMKAWFVDYENTALAAGNTSNLIYATAVDEFVHITNAFVRYTGTVPTNIKLYIVKGTEFAWLLPVKSPASNEYYGGMFNWFLPPEYEVVLDVVGGTLNDDIYVQLHGMRYKLKVN